MTTLSKEVFNEGTKRLAAAFLKVIPAEFNQMFYDKVCNSLNQEQFAGLIERLIFEKYFPNLGRIATIMGEMRGSRIGTRGHDSVLAVFVCSCGQTFGIAKSLNDTFNNGKIRCPGNFYGNCRRTYSLEDVDKAVTKSRDHIIYLS